MQSVPAHEAHFTLPKILDSLLYMTEEVLVDPAIAAVVARLGGRAYGQYEELTASPLTPTPSNAL